MFLQKMSETSSSPAFQLLRIARMPEKKYEPLLGEGGEANEEITLDNARKSLDYPPLPSRNRRRDRTVRILFGCNALLTILLFIVVGLWWRENAKMPTPPYSPAWEAVKYVDKRFVKEDIFYSMDETSPELDAVWLNLTGPSNGHIKLDEAEARKNNPTVELFFKPGYYLYGLNMFHQMHCLDLIRMSFYPKHYFPNKTQTEVTKHKHHCLDFLRQSIMCSGDVTLDHWFNYTWTTPSFSPDGGQGKDGDDWMGMYTQGYKKMTPHERNSQAPLLWDTVHQCRDYDSLYTWVQERQLVDEDYEKAFMRGDDFF